MFNVKLIKLLLVFGTIFIVSILSCKHETPDKKTIEADVIVTKSDTCRLDTIYFVNDILPMILSNCAKSGCHDAATKKDGVQLTDYKNIMDHGEIRAFKPDDSKLYEVLFKTDEKKMPPNPDNLTAEQKNAIRIWINQGALNNKCENKCDTTNVTYTKNIWPIIESTCKGCHSGSNPGGGVYMRNYTEVKKLVDNSKLDGTINHRAGYKPMPQGGKLEQCALDKIKIWINSGAPNN